MLYAPLELPKPVQLTADQYTLTKNKKLFSSHSSIFIFITLHYTHSHADDPLSNGSASISPPSSASDASATASVSPEQVLSASASVSAPIGSENNEHMTHLHNPSDEATRGGGAHQRGGQSVVLTEDRRREYSPVMMERAISGPNTQQQVRVGVARA